MIKTTLAKQYALYVRQLDEAVIEGQLQDPARAKLYGYPKQLELSEAELQELEEFVLARVKDVFTDFAQSEVNPYSLAHFLLNSVVAAMLWETERGNSEDHLLP